MAGSPMEKADEGFIEYDGVKYQQDPENPGQAKLGEDGNLIPYEQKPEEEKPEEKPKVDLDEEPPVRKSAKDFIIARKEKKIKQLQEKGGQDDDGLDDDLTDEGRNAIQREVRKGLEPVLNSVRTQADEQELQNVLAKYPEAKKLESSIRKYMNNEAYENVSVEFIFLGLAAKMGNIQTKKDIADAEARENSTGGNTRRKTAEKLPDVRDMDEKSFNSLLHKVKSGQFINN